MSLFYLEKSYEALERAMNEEDEKKGTQILVENHSKNVKYLKLVK